MVQRLQTLAPSSTYVSESLCKTFACSCHITRAIVNPASTLPREGGDCFPDEPHVTPNLRPTLSLLRQFSMNPVHDDSLVVRDTVSELQEGTTARQDFRRQPSAHASATSAPPDTCSCTACVVTNVRNLKKSDLTAKIQSTRYVTDLSSCTQCSTRDAVYRARDNCREPNAGKRIDHELLVYLANTTEYSSSDGLNNRFQPSMKSNRTTLFLHLSARAASDFAVNRNRSDAYNHIVVLSVLISVISTPVSCDPRFRTSTDRERSAL